MSIGEDHNKNVPSESAPSVNSDETSAASYRQQERRGSWLQGMLGRSALFGPSRITGNIGEDSHSEDDDSDDSCSSGGVYGSPTSSTSSDVHVVRDRSLSLSFLSQFFLAEEGGAAQLDQKLKEASYTNQGGDYPPVKPSRQRADSCFNLFSSYSAKDDSKIQDVPDFEEKSGKDGAFDAGELVHFLTHGPK